MTKSRLYEFIKSPYRSLIFISLPVIAASLVETLYNIVDAVFVGRLGSEALAALSFVWPFYFIIVAISLGINSGISSRLSRYIGEKNKKQAENTIIHGIIIAVILSVIVSLLSIPFLRYVLELSGASGNVLKLSMSYMIVIFYGTILLFVSYGLTSVFFAQGDTKTAMKIDIISLVINIILAPIFIFVFKWGIMGAALATVTAWLIALILAVYYIRKTKYLGFNIKSFKFSKSITKEIFVIGFFSSLMLIIISFVGIFLNRAMSKFGVDYVAALGIVGRIEAIGTLPLYGLSVGAMTLAGMFYGAKKFKLLENVSMFAVKVGILISAVVIVIVFIFPEFFLSWFTNDVNVINVAVPYIRLDILGMPFMAVMMILGRIVQAMGFGFPSLMVGIIRSFVVCVPLAYLFVFVFHLGYLYIAIAGIIAGVVSTFVGLLWFKIIMSKRS